MTPERIDVHDLSVAYDDRGRGHPALVLVHGFTGARSDFAFVVDELARRRRVLALDQRGHRDTTNPDDPATYTFDQLVRDLAAFLEAVAEPPVDLLGHSMGGMVVMRLALARPELVRSLVLMDTAAESPQMPFDFTDDMVEAVFGLARDEGLDAVRAFVSDRDDPEHQLLVAANGADWAKQDEDERYAKLDPAVVSQLGPLVFRHAPVLDRLGELTVPVTVIVGSEDTAFVAPSRRMVDVLADARLDVIDGAYHSPQHTHRREWLAAVERHLARVEKLERT